MNTKIVFSPGIHGSNEINVGGMDLTGLTQTADLALTAGGGALLTLGLLVTGCEVSLDQCEVRINAIPVNDVIGRAVYKSLRDRYEDK